MTAVLKQHPSDSLRLQFYTVAIRPPAAAAVAAATPGLVDLRLLTDMMMQKIRDYALTQQLDAAVRLTTDAQSLSQKGIFFMQAPARFAEEIRTLDGIASVETPLKPSRQPRRAAR